MRIASRKNFDLDRFTKGDTEFRREILKTDPGSNVR